MKRFAFLAALILAMGAALPSFAQPAPPTTAQALMVQLYGLGGAPLQTEQDFTVGTTAAKILKNAPSRVQATIINTGTSNCTISHSATVTATSGLVLAASGGAMSENFRDDLTMASQEHWAVCASAGGTIHVFTIDLQ